MATAHIDIDDIEKLFEEDLMWLCLELSLYGLQVTFSDNK